MFLDEFLEQAFQTLFAEDNGSYFILHLILHLMSEVRGVHKDPP